MNLIKQRAVFFFSAFYGAGVVAGYVLGLNAVIAFITACVLAIGAGACAFGMEKRRLLAGIGAGIFLCAAFCAGAAYVSARKNARPQFENSYNIEFSGNISGQPYTDNFGERFVARLTDVNINGAEFPYDLRIYLRGGEDDIAGVGCGMKISGKGHVFMGDSSTNPHEYDFGSYLWKESLAGYISADFENVSLTGTASGFSNWLFGLRHNLGQRIDRAFGENSDIVRALIIGDRRDMDDDLRDAFSDAGIAHLLAISGLHITIIAGFVAYILRPLMGRLIASGVSVIFIIAYGVLIGFTPSVARAIIMYAALCAAPMAGRLSDATTRLAQAFLIVLLINPLDVGDPGFVLSFMASAGIIWLHEPISRLMGIHRLDKEKFLPRILRGIITASSVTIAAQLATYPAVAQFYGTLPVLSLFTNLIIAPFSTALIVLSMLGTAVPAIAFASSLMVDALKWMVNFCASISWANVDVAAPPIWLWLGFLAVGLMVCDISPIKHRAKPAIVLIMPVMAVIAFTISIIPGMMIVFLDVDQADCTVVQVENQNYIIDLGNNGKEARDYVRGEELDINALFLTHPHSDHAGGLGEFIEEFPVSTIYVSEGWFEAIETASVRMECDEAMAAGAEFVELRPGDYIDLSPGCIMEVISAKSGTGDSLNDMSLVMVMRYGDGSVIFMGDAMAADAPDIDILKVGHHGSDTATDRELLESTTPEIAVISVGKDNSYGHPHEDVLELLNESDAEIFRTDESGAVIAVMDRRGKVHVDTYR